MNPGPILFISLGETQAVVPEAFHVPGVAFQAVEVLTTEAPRVELIQEYFRRHAPGVRLGITRVAGFRNFTSEQDHFRFEEVLFRWILQAGVPPANRWFCLSGGFKTMSAAMQKAASVLGAREVFHVLADPVYPRASGRPQSASTLEEIRDSLDRDLLHWIRLGPEAGWPQLQDIPADRFPLAQVDEADGARSVEAPDQSFRTYLGQLLRRQQHIAESWERLPDLPFSELATWPAADLDWLAQPVDLEQPRDLLWIARLPKVELHCHLGGFATSGEALEAVRTAATHPENLPPVRTLEVPSGWPLPPQPVGLEPYRHLGDNNGSALLRDPGCLHRQCQLLYQHLLDQRIAYAEIRCSPANYADPARGRSPWTVLEEIKRAFDEARQEALHRRSEDATLDPCQVNLLLIGTRQTRGDFRASIARHLALAITAAEHWTSDDECRVVGVDLAGYEDKETRAHYFREEFTGVHRRGLALTVHAGENDDAEGIWRAVFDLNARRLGHALSLAQSPELLRSVVDRGIGLEMCPYANLQIRGFHLDDAARRAPEAERYPLLKYLHAGARVTVNTDNIGISAGTLTDNLTLAARLCPGLTRLDLLRLQRNALETAFLPALHRAELARQFSLAIPRR